MDDQQIKKKQVQIKLDDSENLVEYVNFAVVSHSPAEFILDFIRMLPGMSKANVKSRLIMAPSNVKSLMLILQDNIKKYEDKFGEIKVTKNKDMNPHLKQQ